MYMKPTLISNKSQCKPLKIRLHQDSSRETHSGQI